MKLELDELCSVKDDAALVERIVSKVFEATRKRMETPAFDGVRVAFERLQPSVEVLLQFLRISKDDHALAFIQDHFRELLSVAPLCHLHFKIKLRCCTGTSTHRQDERAACIMRLERRVLSSFDISLFKLLTSNISHEDIARLDESSDDDWVVNRILAEVPAAAMARLEKSAFQSVADLHVVPLRGLPVETLLKFLKIQQDAPALIYIQRCLGMCCTFLPGPNFGFKSVLTCCRQTRKKSTRPATKANLHGDRTGRWGNPPEWACL
jgi:hypothetical protein